MRDYVKELRSLAGYTGFKDSISEMLNNAADELDKYTTEGKWYVRCNSAEEDSYAIVQLNEEEYKTVVKFLAAETVSGGGYCGTCYIINHGFDTKEEIYKDVR